MAKEKELKFKPYVGHFFSFCVENPQIGRNIYGNYIRRTVKLDSLPKTFLIVDEKRNFIRFLNDNNEYYWTRKTHIVPVELPSYDGDPLPQLKKMRDFLTYCTKTSLMDFRIDSMTKMAMELLPIISSMIESYQMKIVSK